MALIDKVPDILEHIKKNASFTEFNEVIFEILEGDLIKHIEVALRRQLISDTAFQSARQGISPINIIKKLGDKLTKLYSGNVIRTATIAGVPSERDQQVVDWYVKNLKVDKFMHQFNYFANTTKVSSIEPFESSDGKPKLRVIPSHQFLPYSDDIVEPNQRTVYIKYMGKKKRDQGEVEVYFLYSDTEFLAIDEDGNVLTEYLTENEGENVFGIIPSVYGNMSDYLLIPLPDTDLLQMGKLIPIMFTHSNDAIKFMSYSIVYGIDVDSENLERNPNVFWVFKSDGDRKPEIGQIKPEVDTTKVIENIMVQFDAWLETKGIKVSGAGKANAQNNMAGITLMIQEMDTTQALKDQMPVMQKAEQEFWHMMAKVHNYWLAEGVVSGLPQMSEDVEVGVEYELPRPIESEDDLLDRAIKARKNGMASVRDALKIWRPKLSEEQIDERLESLEQDFAMAIQEDDSAEEPSADEN